MAFNATAGGMTTSRLPSASQLIAPVPLGSNRLALERRQQQLRGGLSRDRLRVSAVAEAEDTRTSSSRSKSVKASANVANDIMAKLRYQFGKQKLTSAKDLYLGTAWSVRERMMDSFDATHAYWA